MTDTKFIIFLIDAQSRIRTPTKAQYLDIYFKLINVYLYARKEKENNKNINATGYFSEVTSLSQCPTGHRYHHHTSFAFSNNSRLLVILALPKVLTFVIYFHFVKLFPCQQFGIQ